MAIQSIYSASTTTRIGNTVYGFGCNINDSSTAIFDVAVNHYLILTIFDLVGNDTLDLSGRHTDSVILRGSSVISRTGATLQATDARGSSGTDTQVNIERLQFADINLAFDITGNAGQVYRLYQAAFDRTPDVPGLSDWLRGMDAGLALQKVATGFIGSAEFQGLYGANPTNAQFINLLYANVLNRTPDQGGYDYWSDQMDLGLTRELVLIGFSESAENQAAVLPAIQGGISYVV